MRRMNLVIAGPAMLTVGLLAAVAVIAAPANMSAAETPVTPWAVRARSLRTRHATANTIASVHLSTDQMHNAQVIVGCRPGHGNYPTGRSRSR